MTQEDFEFVADQVGLWGDEREALRLQQVERLDSPLIAEQLEIKPAAIREILEQAGRRVAAHEWPSGWSLTDLLDAMRGPRRHDPNAPALRKNEYTGDFVEAVLRAPYPNKFDFLPHCEPSDAQGELRREARKQAKKREKKAGSK